MNAAEQASDLLAAQECESLAACVARGQEPSSYADIVAKLKGHADKLPQGRREFWNDQCTALGVVLYPPSLADRMNASADPVGAISPKKGKLTKPEASSTP